MTRRHRLKLQVVAMLLLSFYSWELACASSTTENNINSHGTTGKDGECVASETACHQTPAEVASQQEEGNDANSSKTSLEYYLRQRFASHPDALDSIRQKLRDGKLVVIHNAFPQAMADAAWADLNAIPDSHWPLHQNCETSGFCYAHHNIYDASQFTATMNDTLQVFDQPASQNFMADLSGRNCYGSPAPGANPPGTASYYMPGDHSLPHTDHISYRTVAYVWHLSKDWRPEWGGALCEYSTIRSIHNTEKVKNAVIILFVRCIHPHCPLPFLIFFVLQIGLPVVMKPSPIAIGTHPTIHWFSFPSRHSPPIL